MEVCLLELVLTYMAYFGMYVERKGVGGAGGTEEKMLKEK